MRTFHGMGASHVFGGASGGREGQMVVELAVVAPVMIVMAVVVLNLMWFLEACARFDRVVPDVVLAVAVSPPGGAEAQDASQEHAVCEAVQQAMEGLRGVGVTVTAQSSWEAADADGKVGFSFAPHLTRYVCRLAYTPWPASLTVAGVDAAIPLEIVHERSFTVDRYRSGVVF